MKTVLLVVSARKNVTVNGTYDAILAGIQRLNTSAYFNAAWRNGAVGCWMKIRNGESDEAFARRVADALPDNAEAMYS